MYYNKLEDFKTHLQNNQIDASFYGIFGEESADQKLIEPLFERLLEGKIKKFDGENFKEAAFFEELETYSLFHGKQAVFLYRIEKLASKFVTQLSNYLENPNESKVLVVFGKTCSAAVRRLEALGVFLQFEVLKPWEKEKKYTQWMMQEIKKEKKTIDFMVAQKLFQCVGADKTLLLNEIEKLICFVGDKKEILLEDLLQSSMPYHTESIWKLGECIFQRQSKEVYQIGEDLLGQGLAYPALLRGLRRQFQTLLEVACLLLKGGQITEIQKRFSYMKGKILEQNLNFVRQYGAGFLKKGILEIDSSELIFKNSGQSTLFLYEKLIAKLILR